MAEQSLFVLQDAPTSYASLLERVTLKLTLCQLLICRRSARSGQQRERNSSGHVMFLIGGRAGAR